MEFSFLSVPRHSHPTLLTHNRCEVYVSAVEDFSDVDVDDMLQLRKKKQLLFLLAFAYVFDLGLPSKFVVNNET